MNTALIFQKIPDKSEKNYILLQLVSYAQIKRSDLFRNIPKKNLVNYYLL